MLRRTLLTMSRSTKIRHLVETAPISRSVVSRFVAGTSAEEAVEASRLLIGSGRLVSLDRLGEDAVEPRHAEATRDAYLTMLKLLADDGLTSGGVTAGAEVSVKLSAVGQSLPGDGEQLALDNALAICEAARNAGTTVTLDMEDHTTTDSTLGILRELRRDFPDTGAVVQAYLRRTEADCRDLAVAGSRVRLCKGAYKEPESVAYQGKTDVDRSFVRCLKVLMAGDGYPMVATHDPRLVAVTGDLARRNAREQGSYEYQMLFGIRPHEQERLAAAGEDAGLRALRRRVVRLPRSPHGRATCEPGSRRPVAGDQGLSQAVMVGHLSPRHGQDGQALLLRHAARRVAGPATCWSPPGAPERAGCCVSATASRPSATPRRPPERRHPAADRQAAGHGGAPGRTRAVRPRRPPGHLGRGRHHDGLHRRAPDRGDPVVRVMTNTPVLVDEAMTAISAGSPRQRGTPARTEAVFSPVGQTIRVPESQQDAGHGAVGQRAGLFLLPGRGHDRRRDPARTAPGRRPRPDRADGDRRSRDAARLRRAPLHAARERSPRRPAPPSTRSATLENHGVRAAFLAALEAARDRGRELAADE